MSEVIPFPKLKKQLNENINESVESQAFEKAYQYINEYESYFELNNEIALVKCEVLWKLEAYLELREETNILMSLGYQPYDTFMVFYIKSLLKLEQYHDVINVIDQVIDEVSEHQTRLILLPLKDQALSKLHERVDFMAYQLQKFNSLTTPEQTKLILALIDDHAFQFVESIKYLLETHQYVAVTQSVMLEYLRLGRYNHSITLSKFDDDYQIIPSQLPGIEKSDFKHLVMPKVIELLEGNAPSLVQEAYVHLNNHNIALYPLDIYRYGNQEEWIHAYNQYFMHLIGQENDNTNSNINKLLKLIKSLNT
ncbi:hypothetical protein [Staphylococcus canis]|uniref:Uncharacterized protein n=1 Tax=Staphylococcus canis TaxID=2724942 RepID=A0ABS0T634_9STAP|nr:hypothetical protein [Staphylococcus canis]MBI5974205.1 hypothetical protein [Staphylococcus canis]